MSNLIQLLTLAGLAALVSVGCNGTGPTPDPEPAPGPKMATKAQISMPCLNPPKVTRDIPGDTLLTDQSSVNCFAWQEFIGLNWPADSASAADFGKPGDTSPVVFETYKTNHDLFDFEGEAPKAWLSPAEYLASGKGEARRPLRRTSKFSVDFDDDDIEEAFPFNPPGQAWLADKHGNLVWYEVLMSKREYDYFLKNKFYVPANQYRAAEAGQHIDLPKGDFEGGPGAMELKAAWLSVPDPDDEKWQRYKLSKATMCSGPDACSETMVALVGLHIIHKTASQPSWIWATFEHVDNAPDLADVNRGAVPDDRYSFYSNDCAESDIPEECIDPSGDASMQMKTSCKPNTHPAYALNLENGRPVGPCQPYPIQVARVFPIPDTNENPVRQTNEAVQNLIKTVNSDSVYQYYRLVNVMWNDSAVDENKAQAVPVKGLSKTAFRPDPAAFPVSNVTMETYIQDFACIECHSTATIPKPKGKTTEYAADYSFVFGM